MKIIPERKEQILRTAIKAWGDSAQVDMAIEEMSELTKALLKYRRAGSNELKLRREHDAILDEMADVKIMMAQLEILYGSPDNEEFAKLCRLAGRLVTAGHDPFPEEATVC